MVLGLTWVQVFIIGGATVYLIGTPCHQYKGVRHGSDNHLSLVTCNCIFKTMRGFIWESVSLEYVSVACSKTGIQCSWSSWCLCGQVYHHLGMIRGCLWFYRQASFWIMCQGCCVLREDARSQNSHVFFLLESTKAVSLICAAARNDKLAFSTLSLIQWLLFATCKAVSPCHWLGWAHTVECSRISPVLAEVDSCNHTAEPHPRICNNVCKASAHREILVYISAILVDCVGTKNLPEAARFAGKNVGRAVAYVSAARQKFFAAARGAELDKVCLLFLFLPYRHFFPFCASYAVDKAQLQNHRTLTT